MRSFQYVDGQGKQGAWSRGRGIIRSVSATQSYRERMKAQRAEARAKRLAEEGA